MKKTALYIVSLIFALHLSAQDIHYSQFFENPHYLNPALTGNFNGNYRFGGLYRNQWQSVTVPFRTFSFYADAKDLFLKKKFSPGISVISDRTGDSKLSTLEINLSGSYKVFQTKDSLHTVSVGVELGFNHHSINYSELSFDNQYNGFYYDPNLSSGEVFPTDHLSYLNVGLGLTYKFQPKKRKSLLFGIALHNLTKPNQSFFDKDIRLDRRLTVFAEGVYKINGDIDVLPSILLQQQGKYDEFIFGARGKYYTHSFPTKAFYFGLFYRNRDAGFIEAGLDYKQWHGSISYDINFSGLKPASENRGGVEIALSYVLSIYKPHYILHNYCPTYL